MFSWLLFSLSWANRCASRNRLSPTQVSSLAAASGLCELRSQRQQGLFSTRCRRASGKPSYGQGRRSGEGSPAPVLPRTVPVLAAHAGAGQAETPLERELRLSRKEETCKSPSLSRLTYNILAQTKPTSFCTWRRPSFLPAHTRSPFWPHQFVVPFFISASCGSPGPLHTLPSLVLLPPADQRAVPTDHSQSTGVQRAVPKPKPSQCHTVTLLSHLRVSANNPINLL